MEWAMETTEVDLQKFTSEIKYWSMRRVKLYYAIAGQIGLDRYIFPCQFDMYGNGETLWNGEAGSGVDLWANLVSHWLFLSFSKLTLK